MGNACACFGGDSDYAFVGRKKKTQEPEITDLDGRTNTDTAVPSGGGGGGYRKTAVAAKYEASSKDVNKNTKRPQSDEEPVLNFTLQTPELEEDDVGQFSKEEHRSDQASQRHNTKTEPTGKNTHVEVFSLAKPKTTPESENSGLVQTPPVHQGKTHVEVFSLNVADDHHSEVRTGQTQQDEEQPTESAHINFTAFLGDQNRGNVEQGVDNLGFVSAETSSISSTGRTDDIPVLDMGKAAQYAPVLDDRGSTHIPVIDAREATEIPVIDARGATDIPVIDARGTTDILVIDASRGETNIPVIDARGETNIPVIDARGDAYNIQSHSTSPGIVNRSFISDDPEDTESLEAPWAHQYVASQGDDDVIAVTNNSESDNADENSFFFGMESLQFGSMKYSQKEYDGLEEDRDIAEIMADIDTIEDGVWTTLKPPTEATSSVPVTDMNRTSESDMYVDVLDQLKQVCDKVCDILKRKGVGSTDETDGDWLKLPELDLLNKKYDKKTIDIQTETANRLARAAKNNDETKVKELLEDYKKQQEKLLRMRDAERRRLMQRLKAKMAARRDRSSSRDDVEDDDEQTDEQTLRAQYGKLIQSDENSEEEVLVGDETSSEYTSDSDDGTNISYSDEESSQEDDAEAADMLKTTLKNDIQTKLRDMTSDDFSSIMDMYRKQRTGIRDIRESERGKLKQSLWDKLSERRRHVDDSVYDGQSHGSSQTPSTDHTERSVGPEPTADTSIRNHGATDIASQAGHVTGSHDASTGVHMELESAILVDKSTGIGDEEMRTLNQDLLSQTTKTGNIDSQDVDQLMKEHFNNVKKLRDAKEQAALLQRQKLLEKLHNRKTDIDIDVESLEKELKEEDNKRAKEEELLERDCMQRLNDRQTVTQKDLEEVLNQYKLSQNALNEHRTHQRELLNQRLQEKLSGRTGAGKSSDEGGSDQTGWTSIENQRTQAEHHITSMDDAFYKSLLERKEAGEISGEELSKLIEEHLDEVDDFRRNIRKQLNQRRRERRQEGAAEQASALVEADKQKREHVRQLRKDERNKMDDKLKEKLRKRKERRDKDNSSSQHPDLPPRKPDRKKSHKNRDTSMTYENVDGV